MKYHNDYYGGFIVSKNIINGERIKYTFREKSQIRQLNGWTLYSDVDDDNYVNDSDNFMILSAESLFQICPVFKELYEAPYGTDLCWIYNQDVLVGFFDLNAEKEVNIDEIVS